jgi:hypothetical protein
MGELSDTHYPNASQIVLVQDNLNTHKPASLYEAFPAGEACRLVERFEWHYTPKHGSWLDMAESELSVLTTQCLDRRIADKQILTEEVAAWEDSRDKKHAKADWQFTTADARIKLKRLYPHCERLRVPAAGPTAGHGSELGQTPPDQWHLVLYDVSSSYMEGRCCPLAQRGYRRDGRKGTLQIAHSLLRAPDGCPVAIEVFEGNTGEPKTLAVQVE